MEREQARVELKYCECCGGLLLRPVGTGAVYCGTCRVRMEKLAPPRPPKHLRLRPQPAAPAGEKAGDEVEAAVSGWLPRIEAAEARGWA
ncbi:MAG: hypothetical protein ACE14L_17490 [Terriglobales bacterium]